MGVTSPHPEFIACGLSSHRLRGFGLLIIRGKVTSGSWQGAGLLDERVAVSAWIPSSCPNSCLLLRILKLFEVSPKNESFKRKCHSLRMSVLILSLQSIDDQ